MEETKITVKLYTPLATAFATQIEGLFLKRDAFLNHMIRIETPRLAEEMKGLTVSPKARRYIAGELKRMGVVPVNVVVDKEVAAALNDVVDRTNMVRDAFINRLILFLRSSDAILKRLGLPTSVGHRGLGSGYEQMPTSPLKAIDSVMGDPFYYLRTALENREDPDGIYLLRLPRPFIGFSCHIDDLFVPTTAEYKFMEREIELLSAQMLDQREAEVVAEDQPGNAPLRKGK